MRKKIEILKHDTNFCPKDIQVGFGIIHTDSVNVDGAALDSL